MASSSPCTPTASASSPSVEAPSLPLQQLPGWNEALLKNRAVQVITVGNKALICCKYEDLKNVSFRQHSSRYCAVPVCKNFRGKIPSLSFFQFPKDLERCKKWISFCKRDDLRCKDAATLYRSGHSICAEHFESCMFMNAGTRNRLIHCAIPTVFDPSHPPGAPSSIKELAVRIHDKDDSKASTEQSELCSFHRKFLKAVTILDTDVDSIHFCTRCGSAIKEKKKISTSIVRAVCKKGHEALFTVEFSQRCHKWTVDCHKLDRSKTLTIQENSCHLCEDHFTCPPVSGSMDSSATVDFFEEPEWPENSVPESAAVTRMAGSDTPSKSIPEYPSLPSSFFSVHGYAAHLEKANVRSSVASTAAQTDGYYHVRARQEPTVDAKKYKMFRQQNYRMRKKIAMLEERLANPPKINVKHVSRELSKYLSGPFLRLVQEQLKAHRVSLHGMRWSDDVVMLAQAIRGESSKAYDILQRILPLPGRSVLSRRPEPPGGLPSLALFLQKKFPLEEAASESSPGAETKAEVVPEQTTGGMEDDGAMEVTDVIHEVIEEPIHLVATSDDLQIYEVFAQAAAAIQENENLVVVQTSVAENVFDSVMVEETT